MYICIYKYIYVYEYITKLKTAFEIYKIGKWLNFMKQPV